MTCEQARALLAESFVHEPGSAVSFELEAHLLECASCGAELATVRKTWSALENLPEVDPGPEVRPRFYQMLEAYQQGRSEAKAKRPAWLSWWPQQPALQFGFSAALLVIGVLAGHGWASKDVKNPE